MKFIHLSDLHIGKRVNEFSMLQEQEYILDRITEIIIQEKPCAVIIAGDVYDKGVPPVEAVRLFDSFLCGIEKENVKAFIISGNHDSPERISFGSQLMQKSGIYMSPVYDGAVNPIVLTDGYGKVNVYMLPFVKPANVRRFYPELEIESYTDALRTAVENMHVDTNERNVIITHQFVTGAKRSDSEELCVGGSDNVDASVFDCFDYVALGHIHRPQCVCRETLRYSGTPLKYSFSEVSHKKSVTVAELKEKGNVDIRCIELTAKRDMREIKGEYEKLVSKEYYDGTAVDDYLHITLTDEEDIPDAIAKLRVIYPNIMKLDYDNTRTRTAACVDSAQAVEEKTPVELFAQFYEKQNNRPMSDEQSEFVRTLTESIWEDEK